MSDKEKPTVQDKIEAQREYRKRTKSPCFGPDNGRCWSCGRQIFEKITLEGASNYLVTGCPYCYRSYVS